MTRFTLYWLPVLAWAGVIFAFSSQSSLPQADPPLLDTVAKKGAHFLEFGVLGWLLLRAFGGSTKLSHRSGAEIAEISLLFPRPYAYALGLALLYAIGDELHQGFTPRRMPSPVDVTIDALGVAAALVAARLLRRSRGDS